MKPNTRHRGAIILPFLLALLLLLITPGLWAQGSSSGSLQESEAAPEPLSEKSRKELDAQFAELAAQRADIEGIERSLRDSNALSRPVLEVRFAQAWGRRMELGLELADAVRKKQKEGADVAAYRERIVGEMKRYSGVVAVAQRTLDELMKPTEPGMSAAEEARIDNWTFELISTRDKLYERLFDTLKAEKALGVNVEKQEAGLKHSLSERASNNSVALALAMREVKGRKAGLTVMPSDTELQAKVMVGEKKVSALAAALSSAARMMDSLGMSTASYRQQVIGATGEISTDIFDPQVLWSLLEQGGQKLVRLLADDVPDLMLKLLIFGVIFFIFRRLAKMVRRLVEVGLDRAQVELSELLRNMIIAISGNIVLLIGVLIGLSQVGISLGPVLAGMGVAGFVVGFALQDTLSNFASGMMILLYRPFDVRDVVEAGGVFGKVHHMSLVNTTILTFDNQTLVVPNNKIWGGVIKNVTAQRTRRVDFTFGVSYNDDIPKTEALLREIVTAHPLVLPRPEPLIRLNELADSSVNFIVRPWVKTADYWDVYWDITREVKLRFDKENISIPFPQRDVHIQTEQCVSARE